MTSAHWLYLIIVVIVVIVMMKKRSVILITTLGIFLIGLVYTRSLIGGVQTVFRAFLIAGKDLFDIMLIIALMVGMLKAMEKMGADYLMMSPFKRILRKPTISFFVLGLIMYVSALFFWPTPATALIGTILIPIAIKSGLPAMAAAMSVNILGHGMALSGDIVIQGAPAITSGAAGIDISEMVRMGGILSLVTGGIAMLIAYFMVRKDISLDNNIMIQKKTNEELGDYSSGASFIAKAVPIVFLGGIISMILLGIKGEGSTAFLGGIAVLFLILISVIQSGNKALEELGDFFKQGFLYAMKIFSTIIPIAGFFFLGSPESAKLILDQNAPGFLFDLGQALSQVIPLSKVSVAFGLLIIGMITGLDGSGFSSLPLIGALAKALGSSMGVNIAALAAIGQMGTIWVGGGTMTAWAFGLVATAGVAGVSPMELARKNFIPVIIGLIVATVVGIYMM
ncbi:MAG: hypothetical protein KAX49_11175 [Halanaerobiales bacterium]|nr:hypothetical protein [Halanaerobiales bacterium]